LTDYLFDQWLGYGLMILGFTKGVTMPATKVVNTEYPLGLLNYREADLSRSDGTKNVYEK